MIEQPSTRRPDPDSGEALDLVSRLERLRPKPEGPSFKTRVLRSAWFATYLMAVLLPLLLWAGLQWRIYTSQRTGTLSALLAIPTCLVVVSVLLRVKARLGITDDAFAQQRFPTALRIGAVWLVGYLSLWSAVFLVLVAVAVQRSPGPSNNDYVATAIELCRWKCRGCSLRATLQGSPSIAGEVCIDGVRPTPKVGDGLTLSGHYFRDGVYIVNVRRTVAPGQMP